MEDSCGKRLSCSTADCTMRYPGRDHLTVEKKKHSMVLNLGPKTTVYSDQTPTPTKLIRKCEEVGLFQDLQNVNPFEETFRKAVEDAKSGATLQVSSLQVDDTLHTPNVFPHIIENESLGKLSGDRIPPIDVAEKERQRYSQAQRKQQNVKVVRQEADTSQLKLDTRPTVSQNNQISVLVDSPDASNVVEQPDADQNQGQVKVLLCIPDGRLVQLSVMPVDTPEHLSQHNNLSVQSDGNTVPKTMGGNTVILTTQKVSEPADTSDISFHRVGETVSLAKQKLKQALLGSSCPAVATTAIEQNKTVVESKKNKIQLPPLKNSLQFETQPANKSNSLMSSDDEEEDKRKKVLERNRVAAMRCREKRKSWVAALERRAEQMLNINQQLQFEVASLRAEVAQLKTLLLAHKDCPVTQAMTQGNFEVHAGMTQVFSVTLPTSANNLSAAGSPNQGMVVLLNPPNVAKKRPESLPDLNFRQNLRKKLRRNSTRKPSQDLPVKLTDKKYVTVKRRSSVDIDIADNDHSRFRLKLADSGGNSSSSDIFSPGSGKDGDVHRQSEEGRMNKPVATQVIRLNPNALNRDAGSLPLDVSIRAIGSATYS